MYVFRVDHLVLDIQLVCSSLWKLFLQPPLIVFSSLCRLKALCTQGSVREMGWDDYKSQRNGKCSVRLCLLEMSEAKPINSQQYGCLNINWTRKTPTDMPMWTGKHIIHNSFIKFVITSVVFSFVIHFFLKTDNTL